MQCIVDTRRLVAYATNSNVYELSWLKKGQSLSLS